MKCEEARLFVDAYVDGEFDDREQAEFEIHLRECDACRAEVDSRLDLKECLKDACGINRAPEGLRDRIMDEIARQSSSSPKRRNWLAYAAAPAAAAIALVAVVFMPDLVVKPVTSFVKPDSSTMRPAVTSALEFHRGDYPVEVTGPASADVSRWFRDKVDFSPRLPDFNDDRIQLVGGRMAHVSDQRAAYAIYEVGGARVSVMMSHDGMDSVPSDNIRQIQGHDVAFLNSKGYEVAVLRNHGITYTMVADLSRQELVDLVNSALTR